MAYAMAEATHDDMRVLRGYVSDDDFRAALDNAPPGIIDQRSWSYWNSKMGRYPAPPLPQRKPRRDYPSLVRSALGVFDRQENEQFPCGCAKQAG